MKTASELIRQYKSLELTDPEKEKWLVETCRNYELQMPHDRIGQSNLYYLLGESYLQGNCTEKALEAFLHAKEILEQKIPVRKKVGCGYQEIEKDYTDTAEYHKVVTKVATLG